MPEQIPVWCETAAANTVLQNTGRIEVAYFSYIQQVSQIQLSGIWEMMVILNSKEFLGSLAKEDGRELYE